MESWLGKPRVLLIDDDSDFTSDLKILLSSEFEIEIASDTREAQEKLMAQQPHCMILDIHMPEYFGDNPEIEGISFLGHIHDSQKRLPYSRVPVLILSAFAEQMVDMQSNSQDIEGLYRKPPDVKKLKAAIWDAVINKRKGTGRIS